MSVNANGVVRNLQRSDQQDISPLNQGGRDQVLSFRVEHTDDNGDVKGYSQVEMRGAIIHGGLSDGDRVEIKPQRRKDGIIKTGRIRNLSTNSDVWVSNHMAVGCLKILFFSVVLMIIGGIIVIIVSRAGGLIR